MGSWRKSILSRLATFKKLATGDSNLLVLESILRCMMQEMEEIEERITEERDT